MKNFRGQAALEFMMTYGWAILVVLAAIGALSFFGILDPSKFTPDTCLASSGFACPGKPIVMSNNVTFSIVNGLGRAVLIQNDSSNFTIKAMNCSTVSICPQGVICTGSASLSIEDGAGITIVLSDCGFGGVSVVKGEIDAKYVNKQSGLTESLKVSLSAKPR